MFNTVLAALMGLHVAPHLGQRCGMDAAVAFSSMSGAVNASPHLWHLNFLAPLYIVVIGVQS